MDYLNQPTQQPIASEQEQPVDTQAVTTNEPSHLFLSKRIIIAGVLAIFVFGFGAYFIFNSSTQPSSQIQNAQQNIPFSQKPADLFLELIQYPSPLLNESRYAASIKIFSDGRYTKVEIGTDQKKELTAVLSKQELQEIQKLVQKNGFMSLESDYEQMTANAISKSITVNDSNQTKTVSVHGSAPPAFIEWMEC